MMLRNLLTVALLVALPVLAGAESTRPNVLFIAIDDMNDWAGFLDSHPQVQTPHMDSLADQGVSFTNAHVPAPICGPSRTAIMSGQWPTTTGIYTNSANFRKDLPDTVSMPQHFRQNGYHVMGNGKIFHGGASKFHEDTFDEYPRYGSSSTPFTKDEMDLAKQDPFNRVMRGDTEYRLPLNGFPADRSWRSNNTFDWGPVDVPDEEFSDAQTANWAVEKLEQEYDKPFFLAVGFHRPHQPLYNPKRFHDLYPPESIELPPTVKNDLDDVPRAGREYALAPNTSGLHKSVAAYGEWENAVSSYLASISFVDELIGNIMAALEDSDYAENTLVVMWSDHGWHLGEKEHWGKATGWYRSTRIPMVVVPPKSGAPEGFAAGGVSTRPVNLLDLAPTIAAATGVPAQKEWEGNSLVPLLADPQADWQEHTHTTFGLGNHSISTARWQYIHYFDGSAELYDLENDPDEFTNLAGDPEYSDVIEHLRQHIPAEPQWKHFVRYHNFKGAVPTDGSEMRLFDLAFRNDVNEQADIAKDYPHIVAKIEKWIAENKPESKFLSITN
jgi:arylsulfatase A-like enzyme